MSKPCRLQDGSSVRMIGFNALELGKKGRTDEPLAVAARERLQALVTASDSLLLGRKSQDHYGWPISMAPMAPTSRRNCLLKA